MAPVFPSVDNCLPGQIGLELEICMDLMILSMIVKLKKCDTGCLSYVRNRCVGHTTAWWTSRLLSRLMVSEYMKLQDGRHCDLAFMHMMRTQQLCIVTCCNST